MFNDIWIRITRQKSLLKVFSLIIKRIKDFVLAKILYKRREALRQHLEQYFLELEPFTEVSLQMGFLRGTQPWSRTKDFQWVCWDAPVRYGLWHHGKPLAGMSVDFALRGIYIVQLQGLDKVKFPESLDLWRREFAKACFEFAEDSGLAYVRYERAAAKNLDHLDTDVRRRIARAYDGTARQLRMDMYPLYSEKKFI